MLGDLSPYERGSANVEGVPISLLAYSLFMAANSLAGFKLSDIAWKETRNIFRRCAVLQLCLSYYVLRFSPWFDRAFGRFQAHGSAAYAVDVAFSVRLVACTLSFQKVAIDHWFMQKREIAVAVSVGLLGLSLLSSYPIQLAAGGDDWWRCAQENYPRQNVGLVGYVFVRATVTFSLMLFGATLYQRGIVNDRQFGLGSAFITMTCLVGTVLTQELHIPFVSTMRLYIPCEEPADSTWEEYTVNAMDFSIYARNFWRSMRFEIVREQSLIG